MSLRARRYLYIVFIIAFLIITPLLIFYSLGYTISDGLKIQKSGILIVATEPKGAKISVEGKDVQKFWSKVLGREESFVRTPAKIKNIKPGEYNFTASLPGYWPWTKKLVIEPGQTTFAEDIYLFRNDKPASIMDLLYQGITDFSPNKKYFLDINKDKANILNLESGQIISIALNSDTLNNPEYDDISWSRNEKKILTGDYIISADDNYDPIIVDSVIGENFSKSDWDDSSDQEVLYINNQKLFSYNFNNDNNKELLDADHLDSFLSKDGKIFLIEKNPNNSRLIINDRGTGLNQVILELPYSDYDFINKEHNLLNVFDKKHSILYLINPYSNIRPLKEVIYGSDQMQWVDSSKLLFSTGFEIWVFDLNSLDKKLLTRISDKIKNIAWHPSNNYILFSTSKSINILELDDREKYSVTRIGEFESIDKMILDKKGEIVYFTTATEGNNNLYKIFIQ